jgi:hypothetical protein
MQNPWSTLVLIAVTACSHSGPFEQEATGTSIPFQSGPPARITANPGDDGDISFTPGGELLYSVSRMCLGFIPVREARAREWRCPPPEAGVSDAYRYGIVSPGGRIALLLRRQREFESGPFYQAILVARLDDFRDSAEVTPVPFVSGVDGELHREITQITWLRGDTLAILADGAVYLTDPDDRSHPRVHIRLPLPGFVTGIQSRGGRLLYLHLNGDSRVLAWSLETGTLSQVHDFSIAIGAFASGGHHLVAMTGVNLVRVDLSSRRSTVIPTMGLDVAELAISPDGADIIASGVIPAGPPPSNTGTDLYRLQP